MIKIIKKFIARRIWKWTLAISILIVIASINAKIFGAPITPTTDIIVKVGDGPDFEDGDVIHAFSQKEILHVHAQHIVHPKNMPRTNQGTIQPGVILEDYLEDIKEFKFERTGQKQVKRTNLWTGEVDFISEQPNAKEEYMDVPLYIKRRLELNPNDNLVFGNAGNEYWYGGGDRITDTLIDKVWDKIEAKTSHNRNYNFPFTERETKAFAVLKIKNLSDPEIRDLVAPEIDNEGKIIKTRAKKIDWNKVKTHIKSMPDIQNKAEAKDLRSKSPVDINDILK